MKKKHLTKAKEKLAWECYLDRISLPLKPFRPTKEEKEMLRKVGYIVK